MRASLASGANKANLDQTPAQRTKSRLGGRVRFFCLVCGFLLSLLMMGLTLSQLLAPATALAQEATDELLTLSVEGTSKAASASEASRDITAWATSQTARTQVIDLVGEAKYQKNKAAIENRIVKQASKFIPFVNPGSPVQQPDGSWKMPVELRISAQSLRKMVLDAGFLSDAEGPAAILPLISFNDRIKGISLQWWMGEPKTEAYKFLGQLSRVFHDRLQIELTRQGFHFIKPTGAQNSPVPEAYRNERLSNSDLLFFSDYFKAPMVLKGDVRFRESPEVPGAVNISAKLQVMQAATGRTVAEVSRNFVTDSGPAETVVRNKMNTEMSEMSKDLSVQVLEAWQRGTLNANLVRLAVRGSLGPKDVAGFKSGLMRSVREVKGLKERLFEPGQVVFEVDYSGEANGLASRLKALQIPNFSTHLDSASAENGLVLSVKTR